MASVAEHFRAVHEREAHNHELLGEKHAKAASRNRRIAEIHRQAHKASGMSSSTHSELAVEHDSLAEDHEDMAKRHREEADFHRGMATEVEKSAATVDLNKSGRAADDLVPSRVSAIGALPRGRLIERTGHVGARTGTDDAPVAPQLAKIVAMDD